VAEEGRVGGGGRRRRWEEEEEDPPAPPNLNVPHNKPRSTSSRCEDDGRATLPSSQGDRNVRGTTFIDQFEKPISGSIVKWAGQWDRTSNKLPSPSRSSKEPLVAEWTKNHGRMG